MPESFINYADKEDIKSLFNVAGIKNAAKIFFEQIETSCNRFNYFPEFQNYFILYFKKYAPWNFAEENHVLNVYPDTWNSVVHETVLFFKTIP